MHATTKLLAAVTAVAGLSLTLVGIGFHDEARAAPVLKVDQSNPTITITNDGVNYVYSPAAVDAKVGQAITITNNDQNGVHSVTAKDKSFSVDIPPQTSVTFKISKPGSYPYYCQYHTDAHNEASVNVS